LKPNETIATATTPDGKEIVLIRHDQNYSISVDREVLMTSRQHESELALARFGCDRLIGHRNPTVLIGGLGLGYTLRQTLDMLEAGASVTVAELLPQVVQWNRDFIGDLTAHPLRDKRVKVETVDVVDLIKKSRACFDAILLDVDNGPNAMTAAGNDWLYRRAGIEACMRALHAKGCLAIWSAHVDKQFQRRLQQAGFHARYFRVTAYKGSKAAARCIWVVSREKRSLPEMPESTYVKP